MNAKSCVCSWLLGTLFIAVASAETPQRTNVLLLVADDLRPDVVGVLGGSVTETPNLDRLAKQGTVLTHATCAYPLCFPSRAELLTGCSSFRTGVGIRTTRLGTDLTLLPEVLRKAGYRTVHVGKWHVAGRPSDRGFESVSGHYAGGKKPEQPKYDHRGALVTGYAGWQFQTDDGHPLPELGIGLTPNISAVFADAAIEVITQDDSRPFFLHVNFTAPHDPRLFPSGFEKKYNARDLMLPNNFRPQHPFDHGNLQGRDELLIPMPRAEQDVRAETAAYYAVVSHLDAQLGRILGALDESNQAANTLVIFTSDHGLALGSHGLLGKQNMYDHTIRVPLILRGANIPPNAKRSALCYLRDLFPTICEWCGVGVPADLDGRSLAPVLKGNTESVYPFVTGYFQNVQRMIRNDQRKLIWYPEINKEQLFDLTKDPDELQDLAGLAVHADLQNQMRTQLRQWFKERNDPVFETLK